MKKYRNKTVGMLLKICKKVNIVPSPFLSLYLPYRKRKVRCLKCQQLATNLQSFNITLLQQFTEPRTTVLLNARNCPKIHNQSAL